MDMSLSKLQEMVKDRGASCHKQLDMTEWQNHEKICTHVYYMCMSILAFPGDASGKELAFNARDMGLIPGSGRSPGGVHGNPLQDSCLENPMDREAWQTTVHGVAESNTTEVT